MRVTNKPIDLGINSHVFGTTTTTGTTRNNTMIKSHDKKLNKSLSLNTRLRPLSLQEDHSSNNFNNKRSLSRGTQVRSKFNQIKKIKNNKSSNSLLESRIRPSTEKQHVIKSIVFPNNQKSDLHEEVDFLKKQIVDIRAFY